MAGIVKGKRHAIGDEHWAIIVERNKLAPRALGIFHAVEGLHGWEIFLGAFARDVFGVVLLNARGISEHDGRQIARGVGAENVAAIALFHKVGEISAVINVRMAQNRHINGGGIK